MVKQDIQMRKTNLELDFIYQEFIGSEKLGGTYRKAARWAKKKVRATGEVNRKVKLF